MSDDSKPKTLTPGYPWHGEQPLKFRPTYTQRNGAEETAGPDQPAGAKRFTQNTTGLRLHVPAASAVARAEAKRAGELEL